MLGLTILVTVHLVSLNAICQLVSQSSSAVFLEQSAIFCVFDFAEKNGVIRKQSEFMVASGMSFI